MAEVTEREALTLEKIRQEARRAEAQAEAAMAEAEDYRSNAIKNLADAELTRVQTISDRLSAEKDEREAKEELAANKYHHKYNFTSAVDSESSQALMDQMEQWSRLAPTCAMEVVFSSPGGSVIDGLALFDFIQMIRNRGHKVTTGAIGYAASMAGILLQAGEHRWIGRECYILVHEVSFGAGGKIGEVEDEVKFIKKIQNRVLDIFAMRIAEAGRRGTAKKPLTKTQLAQRWERKDWWIESSEALEWGFVDEIR